MEALIELVAASFARHGIECPAADSPLARPAAMKSAQAIDPAEPLLTTALPEHNFKKTLEGDLAP